MFHFIKKYILLYKQHKEIWNKYHVKLPLVTDVLEYFVCPDFNIRNTNVLDIGSGFLDYAIISSKYYKNNVVSYEPVIKQYKKGLKLNKINNAYVTSFNTLILPHGKNIIKDVSIYKNMVINSDFIGKIDTNKLKLAQVEITNSSDLYDYFFCVKLGLIKIDVEGNELLVLESIVDLIEMHLPKIIIEVHSLKIKNEVIGLLCEKYGYEITYESIPQKNNILNMDNVQLLYLKIEGKK